MRNPALTGRVLGRDLMMLDPAMPDGEGLVFLGETRSWPAPPRVLVVTGRGEGDPAAADAMRLGARGYLSQLATGEQLLGAPRQVCAGETYLSPVLIARLAAVVAVDRVPETVPVTRRLEAASY